MSPSPSSGLDQSLSTPEAIEDFALSDDYALNPEYIELVIDAADRGDGMRVRELVEALHPADVADLMGFLSAEYRAEVTPWIPADRLAEILPELDDRIREEVLEHVAPGALAEALQELDSDDAAAVVDDLEDDQRKAVLAAMPEPERAAIEKTLAFEEDSAGRLMQREVIAAPQFWSVGQALAHIRENVSDMPELFFDLYVVDPAFKPVGAVSLSRLVCAKPEVRLIDIMDPVTELRVDQDQEAVAYIFEKYNLISAPVIDAGGRLIGQITVDDIVSIIQEEGREDILALVGVSDAGRDASAFGVARSRFVWLLLNFLTSILTAGVIAFFLPVISHHVALAMLAPIAVWMGSSSGSQTLTVIVKALGANELTDANLGRTAGRELTVAALNGLLFAVLMFGAAALVFHNFRLGACLAAAMVVNFVVAAVIGLAAPVILNRLGRDPAAYSSVLVKTLANIVGFAVFLGLASILLQ